MPEEVLAAGSQTQDSPASTPETLVTTPGEPEVKAPEANGDGQDPAGTAKPDDKEVVYEFVVPDGVTLNEGSLSAFKDLAKADGLKPEQAQKYVDLAVALQTGSQAEADAAFAAQRDTWVASSKADPELGGEKFDSNMKVMQAGFSKVGTPELKAMLEQTGYGNHPEIARLFYRVGKAMSGDTTKPANPNASTQILTNAEVFYGGGK